MPNREYLVVLGKQISSDVIAKISEHHVDITVTPILVGSGSLGKQRPKYRTKIADFVGRFYFDRNTESDAHPSAKISQSHCVDMHVYRDDIGITIDIRKHQPVKLCVVTARI